MIRKIKKKLCEFLFEDRWEIGFVDNSLEDVMSSSTPLRINWINNPYTDRWFADPFILEVSADSITILAEEFKYKARKGVIVKLTIDRNTYTLLDRVLVLELDTHLSFPFIRHESDGIYIYPESGESGEWVKYRYENDKCEKVGVVVKEALADAVYADVLDHNLIVTTQLPDANGKTLHVYEKQLEGNYLEHEVHMPSNISRNAGQWFRYNDAVYRPAQDCNVTYGGGVIIQKVEKKDNELSFIDVRRIDSDSKRFGFGCHTFNFYEGCIVVDAHGYRRYKLMRLIGRV